MSLARDRDVISTTGATMAARNANVKLAYGVHT